MKANQSRQPSKCQSSLLKQNEAPGEAVFPRFFLIFPLDSFATWHLNGPNGSRRTKLQPPTRTTSCCAQ